MLTHIDEEDPNESRYLGQNSIAAFLSEEAQAGESLADGEQDVIRKDIMPILGLQISSASYPFMSREHMDKIRLDIAAALPSDRDVLKYDLIFFHIVEIETNGMQDFPNIQTDCSAVLGFTS